MPDQLQLRGGTTVQHSTFTGASKEVTVDTTKKTAVVHDGATAGGIPVMREDASNSALALGSAGTPSLKFIGDTNTGIFSPAADTLAFAEGGVEAMRIDSGGRLLVGLSTSVGGGAAIQSVSSSAQVFEGITSRDDVYGSFLYLTKSRGTIASPTIVSNNDIVGAVTYKAYSGTSYLETASIEVDIDGTPGASAMPSRIRFLTAGASGGIVERMRLDSSGRLLVGTSTANTSGAKLQTSDGLTFPATAVASADPNTLDDYEEGTWTPTIVDSIGAAVMTSGATGFYTKIGNQVTLSFNQISWSSKGTLATSPITIAGFPFASRSSNRAVGQLNLASSGSFTLANRLILSMEASQSQAGLYSVNATSNEGTAYSVTTLGTSGIIYGMSLTYTV